MDILQNSNVSLEQNMKISGFNITDVQSKTGVSSVDDILEVCHNPGNKVIAANFSTHYSFVGIDKERPCNFNWEPGLWTSYVGESDDDLSKIVSSKSVEKASNVGEKQATLMITVHSICYGAQFYESSCYLDSCSLSSWDDVILWSNVRINKAMLIKYCNVYIFKGGTHDRDISSQSSSQVVISHKAISAFIYAFCSRLSCEWFNHYESASDNILVKASARERFVFEPGGQSCGDSFELSDMVLSALLFQTSVNSNFMSCLDTRLWHKFLFGKEPWNNLCTDKFAAHHTISQVIISTVQSFTKIEDIGNTKTELLSAIVVEEVMNPRWVFATCILHQGTICYDPGILKLKRAFTFHCNWLWSRHLIFRVIRRGLSTSIGVSLGTIQCFILDVKTFFDAVQGSSSVGLSHIVVSAAKDELWKIAWAVLVAKMFYFFFHMSKLSLPDDSNEVQNESAYFGICIIVSGKRKIAYLQIFKASIREIFMQINITQVLCLVETRIRRSGFPACLQLLSVTGFTMCFDPGITCHGSFSTITLILLPMWVPRATLLYCQFSSHPAKFKGRVRGTQFSVVAMISYNSGPALSQRNGQKSAQCVNHFLHNIFF